MGPRAVAITRWRVSVMPDTETDFVLANPGGICTAHAPNARGNATLVYAQCTGDHALMRLRARDNEDRRRCAGPAVTVALSVALSPMLTDTNWVSAPWMHTHSHTIDVDGFARWRSAARASLRRSNRNPGLGPKRFSLTARRIYRIDCTRTLRCRFVSSHTHKMTWPVVLT